MPRTTRPQRPAAGEDGTALVLVPAMMLVLIVLAGIAVDLVASHVAQRSLYRTVSAAADDAAGMIDGRRLQADGSLTIDDAAAERVVRTRLATSDLPGPVTEAVVDTDDTTVEVRVRVLIPRIFLRAVPGADDAR